MVFYGLTDTLGVFDHRAFVAWLAQQAEGIVAQTCQGELLSGLFLEQVGQIPQEQVCAGNAYLPLHAHKVVQGDVSQRTGLILLAGSGNGFGECIHQVLTVVEASQKILAADLAKLFFQFRIAVLWLQHNLCAASPS